MRMKFVNLAFKESNETFLPHAYASLRSYIQEFHPELDQKIEWLEPLFHWNGINDLDFKNFDILSLSCYVWNVETQLEIAKQFKKNNPNGIVIVGGPEISESLLNKILGQDEKFIDYAVLKEGETGFVESLQRIFKVVTGDSIFIRSSAVTALPTQGPFLSGLYDDIIKNHKGGILTALWETTRGCPFNCSFCNWGSYTSSNIRPIDFERLKSEIEWFGKNKIEHLYITDANFGILSRDVELAEMLAETRIKTGYPKQVWANYNKNTNDRVLKINNIFIQAGMSYTGVTISVQSLNEDTLSTVKRENIGFRKYFELEELQKKNNIISYTELILGLPGETKESFAAGIDQLVRKRIRNIRIYPALVLENTDFSNDNFIARNGIQTKRKKIYLSQHRINQVAIEERSRVIVSTNTFTYEDMLSMYKLGHLAQALYCTGLIKYIFDKFLSEKIKFSQFLEILLSSNIKIFEDLNRLADSLVDKQWKTDATNMFGVQIAEFEYEGRKQEIRSAPWNLIWMFAQLRIDEFLEGIQAVIKTIVHMPDEELRENIKVQKFLLLDLEIWKNRFKRESFYFDPFSKHDGSTQLYYKIDEKKHNDNLFDYLIFSTGSTVITEFKYLVRQEKIIYETYRQEARNENLS